MLHFFPCASCLCERFFLYFLKFLFRSICFLIRFYYHFVFLFSLVLFLTFHYLFFLFFSTLIQISSFYLHFSSSFFCHFVFHCLIVLIFLVRYNYHNYSYHNHHYFCNQAKLSAKNYKQKDLNKFIYSGSVLLKYSSL